MGVISYRLPSPVASSHKTDSIKKIEAQARIICHKLTLQLLIPLSVDTARDHYTTLYHRPFQDLHELNTDARTHSLAHYLSQTAVHSTELQCLLPSKVEN